MATIAVSNTASLAAALKSAVGGDVIKLMPGTYSDLEVKQAKSFSTPVTITSADPNKLAVLTDFEFRGWKGLTFSQVEMRALDNPDLSRNDGNYVAFEFRHCSDILIDRVNVHGSLDNNPRNDVQGILFSDGKNFTVMNSEFEQLKRALLVGRSENVKISENDFHDLRSDATNFVQVKNVEISKNNFSDFYPSDHDHADAIQFFTTNSVESSKDIKIFGNVFVKGDGDYFQGVFLRDQKGTLPFERVDISNNFMVGTGHNAIKIMGASDIKLTENELISFYGENKTYFSVEGANGVVAKNNKAHSISFGDSINIRQSGNEVTGAVQDFGSSAIQKHIAAFGDRGGVLGSAMNDAVVLIKAMAQKPQNLIGDWKANELKGGDSNDTLDGRGGDDTLTGGAGDDTYIVPNGAARIIEGANAGTDTVIARGDHVLAANIENLIISPTATNNWAGTGNELANKITGNGGSNLLRGMSGNDTIDGGAGADTILGGVGNDRLTGGAGADVFRFTPGGGRDEIIDFGWGVDKDVLDISAYLNAGLRPTVMSAGDSSVITFANGDAITIVGVQTSELGAHSKVGWVF